MKRQTLVFGVVLVLIVVAVLWFTVGLPEVYRNQDAIVATHNRSVLLTEAAVIATSRAERTKAAGSP